MLEEQKTIFYSLADWAVFKTVKLENLKEVRYLDLAFHKVGEHYYTLRLSINYLEGVKYPEVYLEGIIEDNYEGILRMASASMSVEKDIDLRALIKEFKNVVDDKYQNRRNGDAAVQVLINMALSHLGHRTDDFAKKSLDFYKLIQTHNYISFVVREKYELVFYRHAEEKTIGLCVYRWQTESEREMCPIVKCAQPGFSESNAHLFFLKLIGGLQEELMKTKID